MRTSYTQLTQEERYQIYAFLKAGFTKQEVSVELGRHVSTIRRECNRNKGLKGYRPKQAHRLALVRHFEKEKSIKMTESMQETIRSKLAEEWSPEQIQGRLTFLGETSVCPKTIYEFIAQDKLIGGELHKHLRHKKYRRRTGSKDARGRIRNRVSIDERPEVVDLKERIGDWEADTVIGKGHKGVLVTLSERHSKLNLIAHVPTKHADVVTKAIITMLEPYKNDLKTITFDNGKEFAHHEDIKKKYGIQTYFAHPYSSWERGLNENHNGLIRQYFLKEEPLDKVTNAEVEHAEQRLNQRPRKLLGYKTPEEVYTYMALAA